MVAGVLSQAIGGIERGRIIPYYQRSISEVEYRSYGNKYLDIFKIKRWSWKRQNQWELGLLGSKDASGDSIAHGWPEWLRGWKLTVAIEVNNSAANWNAGVNNRSTKVQSRAVEITLNLVRIRTSLPYCVFQRS